MDDTNSKVTLALMAVLLVLSLTNLYITNAIIFSSGGATEISNAGSAGINAAAETVVENLAEVKATIVFDSSCSVCFDMSAIVDSMKSAGVNISDVKSVAYGTEEASMIISSKNITRLPALMLSSGISAYPQVLAAIKGMNATLYGSEYVLPPFQPPFVDLASGKVSGVLDIIRIVDGSCSGCYNVSAHDGVLRRFGIAMGDDKTYDVNSSKGKAVVSKYNITLVPTIALSPDASLYSILRSVWTQVGSVESDGWYVFRDVKQMGTHRNLITKETINITLSGG